MNRPHFGMFFYGTLKRGQRNHAYCRGALRVRGATVQGFLYDLPEGYPALVVPERNILAVGTADPLRDAGETLGRSRTEEIPAPDRATVFGELYTFDDAEERLPALDRLEGFVPGDPTSPYKRVLVSVRAEEGTLAFAWSYVVRYPVGRHLPGGRWPA